MADFLKVIGSFFAMVAVIFLVALAGQFFDFWSLSFFAPKIEQVRYNTFKQSQAYNDGMIRDLEDLKRQYLTANSEQKKALRALTLHRFEIYDRNRLPSDLQAFYDKLEVVNQ